MRKRYKAISLFLMLVLFITSTATVSYADVSSKGFDGKIYYHAERYHSLKVIDGIDISEWQGYNSQEAFERAKNYGVNYAILRSGFTGSETLRQTADAHFETNYENAKAAGIKLGVYFYSLAINASEAANEAEFVINQLRGKSLDYPVYIDIEDARQSDVGKSTLSEVANTFCQKIRAAGYKAGVYASTSWLDGKIGSIDRENAVWVAQYYNHCEYEGKYTMWQYSSSGRIDGLEGNIDSNFYYVNGVEDIENFHANPYAHDEICLTWDEAVDDSVSYEVYRSESASGQFEKIATVPNDRTFYVDDNLVEGHKYYYKLRGYDGKAYGSYTSVDYAVPRVPELKDFGVGAVDETTCKAYWDEPLNKNLEIEIYRSLDGINFEKVGSVKSDVKSYLDNNLEMNKKYYYKAQVAEKVGEEYKYSSFTDVDWGVTRTPEISGFSAKGVNYNTCLVGWDKAKDKSSYEIYRSTDSKNWKLVSTVPNRRTTYTDTYLTTYKKYYYKARLVVEVEGEKYYTEFSDVDWGIPRVTGITGFTSYAKDFRTA